MTAPISCCAWNVTFRGRQVPAWQETTWKTNDRTPAGHKGPSGLPTLYPVGVASLLISVGSLRSRPQAPRCPADPPCGVTLWGERALEPADLGFPASRSRMTRPSMKGPGRRSLPEESVAITSLSLWPLPRYQSKYTANHETRGQDQPPRHSSASICLCNQTEGHQERPRSQPWAGPAPILQSAQARCLRRLRHPT